MTDAAGLTAREIQDAADALHDSLNLQNDHTGRTVSRLRELLEERIPGCEKNYLALKHGDATTERELPDEELPRFAISLLGTEFFEGKFGKSIRALILDRMFDRDPDSITHLAESGAEAAGKAGDGQEKLLDWFKKRQWNPGGSAARRFVRFHGFHVKFAGTTSEKKPKNVEHVKKRILLPELLPFQANLKTQVLSILEKDRGRGNRGILRLPTGSGKTRIAVEAVIEFWKNRPPASRFIMWIAQTEELCEQALQSFKQVWEEHGTEDDELSLYRVWGSRGLPDAVDRGIIIAGIHQLDKLIPKSENTDCLEDELARIKDHVGAVIVDEAHTSVTAMYTKVFSSLEIPVPTNDSKQIPLLGITATPYRSGDYQTNLLRRQYNNNILSPSQDFEPRENFDDNWKDHDFVLQTLTNDQVLSIPRYYYHDSGSVFSMDKRESEFLESHHILPDTLLDKVGSDPSRNLTVYGIIKEWADRGRSILFFGANVNQAVMMKEFLNQNGVKSAVITADTKYGNRHEYIRMFREGKEKIQVLCNYRVLTTGFDSPKVDTVIIARPTGSRLMYEQMIGRGLRGPRFGGTRTCDIITVLDNILNYGHQRIKLGHEAFVDTTRGISDEERKKIETNMKRYEPVTLEPAMPETEDTFTNAEIQERFGVQNRGGIRFTHKHKFVILIDSSFSEYEDHVDEESGLITYFVAGSGDQGFDSGTGKYNAKVRDAGSSLLYFQKPEQNKIIFKYRVKYDSHSYDKKKNPDGTKREVIRFMLKIIKKMCPSCMETFASNEREIGEKFGFRTINGRTVPQSWCKECRR